MASTPPPLTSDLHLKRPCMLVADLQRSLTLYRDILGFKLDYIGEASPESYLYTVFQLPSQSQLTFAALSTDREPRALALTEVKGITLQSPLPPYRIGVVIQVPDVTDTIQRIHALELPIVPSSSFTAPPNLAFTEQGFHDFDGHLIILYETRTIDVPA